MQAHKVLITIWARVPSGMFEFQTVIDDLSCEQFFPLESRTRPGTQVLVCVPSLRGDVSLEGFKPTILSKDTLVKE